MPRRTTLTTAATVAAVGLLPAASAGAHPSVAYARTVAHAEIAAAECYTYGACHRIVILRVGPEHRPKRAPHWRRVNAVACLGDTVRPWTAWVGPRGLIDGGLNPLDEAPRPRRDSDRCPK
jgi:hypothetical protein